MLFIILPVAVAVIFFIAAADINKIKKLKIESDALILSRLERIEKAVEELRKSLADKPAQSAHPVADKSLPQSPGGWAEGVTDAEKREASVLMPRLADMQGVIMKIEESGGYEVWSRYSWEKFGCMDPGYRLIFRNYTE